MEIERKFLLNKDDIPKQLNTLESSGIRQGYLNPSDTYIIRVRGITPFNPFDKSAKVFEHYIMEIKSNGLLLREEWEFKLSEERFEEILEKCNRKIAKVRYYFKENDLTYEIDEYVGTALWTVEVEFKTEEKANEFVPPSWFGKDVTLDSSYKNMNLVL